MTIASDILAQAPLVYWKLDDGTGPAASDSSGNGHPGAYGGSFSLGVPGPEVGTTACQLGGGTISLTTPLTGNVSQTLLCYASISPLYPTTLSGFLNNGDSSVALRGLHCKMEIAGGIPTVFGTTQNDAAFRSAAITQPVYFWHCYGAMYDAATSKVYAITDGTLSAASVGNSVALTTNAGDELAVLSAGGLVVAHVALFNRILTAGQIAGIGSHSSTWPYGLMIPYPSSSSAFATTVDTAALATDIAAILASVRRVF